MYPTRARQWSRTAWALAILFGSLPLVSRVLLGVWEFDGAVGMAGLCLLAGAYFHLIGRRRRAAVPDSATLLNEAIGLASTGRTAEAAVLLTAAIRLSPRLWQAFQYRGGLCLRGGEFSSAIEDFTDAIRLAPGEPHLYQLRAEAYHLLGDQASANQDLEMAARFSQLQR